MKGTNLKLTPPLSPPFLQKNIHALIKFQASRLKFYEERNSGTVAFLWILQNVLEHNLYIEREHNFDRLSHVENTSVD